MSTNSGSSTDAYSSENDSSSSDSEENIVCTKPPRILNLLPGQSIVRGIPGRFSRDELSCACVWGNTVTLYRRNVIHLRRLIKAKETPIPYYVCQLNKTFASPTQRMYFNMNFSRTYLLAHMPLTKNVLPIKNEDRNIHVSAQLIKGVDGRATVTSGWKTFVLQAELAEGNICAFVFKPTTRGLRLTVHVV